MHSGQLRPGYIDPELHGELSGRFMQGLNTGFGKKLGEADFNTPDYGTIASLRNNLHAFSAAKSYSQIKAMNELILDDQGKIRSYSDFKDLALQVHADYNRNWLNTEYNTAIGQSQMAARWNEYQANDAVPNITINTAGDERVRDTHVPYDGFTRPKNDPVWRNFWPPFDWACRCDATETDGEVSDRSRVNPDDIPTLFRSNSGMSGVVFKGSHPYFKDVDGSVSELQAVRNYGLPAANKRYVDPNKLTKAPEPVQLNRWFNQEFKEHGHKKDSLLMDDALGGKVSIQKKIFGTTSYANHAPDTLLKADEVWQGKNSGLTYIRYYQERAVVVKTDKRGIATRFETMRPAQVEPLRRGVLMHMKK